MSELGFELTDEGRRLVEERYPRLLGDRDSATRSSMVWGEEVYPAEDGEGFVLEVNRVTTVWRSRMDREWGRPAKEIEDREVTRIPAAWVQRKTPIRIAAFSRVFS